MTTNTTDAYIARAQFWQRVSLAWFVTSFVISASLQLVAWLSTRKGPP